MQTLYFSISIFHAWFILCFSAHLTCPTHTHTLAQSASAIQQQQALALAQQQNAMAVAEAQKRAALAEAQVTGFCIQTLFALRMFSYA
jgi:hypothetical protein